MLRAAVLAVLGLAALVVGLWPGVVSVRLSGAGHTVLFLLGVALLAWGGAWLAMSGDGTGDCDGNGNDPNTGSNPGASGGGRPPTLGG